jgi:hypothetical protein
MLTTANQLLVGGNWPNEFLGHYQSGIQTSSRSGTLAQRANHSAIQSKPHTLKLIKKK